MANYYQRAINAVFYANPVKLQQLSAVRLKISSPVSRDRLATFFDCRDSNGSRKRLRLQQNQAVFSRLVFRHAQANAKHR